VNLGELFRELMEDAQPQAGSSIGPDGSTEWERDGVVFAVIAPDGMVASFRLDPELAGAARRTPRCRGLTTGRGLGDLPAGGAG